jgi:hypothetical protein
MKGLNPHPLGGGSFYKYFFDLTRRLYDRFNIQNNLKLDAAFEIQHR